VKYVRSSSPLPWQKIGYQLPELFILLFFPLNIFLTSRTCPKKGELVERLEKRAGTQN